jgi:Putative Ig domain
MALATTVVDANTLAGTIGSDSLATPATVQLQVRNTQTMQESQAVPIVITPTSAAPSNTLGISATSLPNAVVGNPYNFSLTASGGSAPYIWTIPAGQLPAGLSLAPNSGIISGTPTSSGSFSLNVTATDSNLPAQSVMSTLGLLVAPAPTFPTTPAPSQTPTPTPTPTPPSSVVLTPLVINSSAVSSGIVGSPYSSLLQASGGTAPYTWSISGGSLPSGLILATSGLISGTPSASGTATFTASVSDSAAPAQTKSTSFSLIIAPSNLTISSSSSTLPGGTVNSTYSTLLHAAGGTPPYSWAVSEGNLPAGLTLGATTGIISGTPTTSGNYVADITVIDSSSPVQSATATADLRVQGIGNTFTNLQRSTGWKSSGQMAPNYTDCDDSCPGVTLSMQQGISDPSLSGNATEFGVGGTTPYSDALFYNQLIGAFSTQGLPDNSQTLVPSLHNFTYDAYFYVPDAADTQAVEFDINWFMNSVGITWGTECRIKGGNEWDIWDNVNAKWIATGFACNPIPNAWNHVIVTAQRGPNNTVIYQSITLNGITSNVNKTYAPFVVPSDWYGITVNYQIDGDENQTTIKSFVDNFSFTYQ